LNSACTIKDPGQTSLFIFYYQSIMGGPRPVLKALSFLSTETASNPLPFSSCSTILDSPHVHFPPTPTLTSTEITHSPFTYDRAPIVVAPNLCALPERGGRKIIGGNINQGGRGYFHPHAKFQVEAVRVERDSSETVSPAIFSASVTLGNVNDCGSVGLLKKKRSPPMYKYDEQYSSHNQHNQHAQDVISSLILDTSAESSDLGVAAPYVPTLSSSFPSSMPHSALNKSPRNVYDTLSVPPSPRSTTSNNTATSPDKKRLHKRKSSVDVSGEKKKQKGRAGNSDGISSGLELEGCLGGF